MINQRNAIFQESEGVLPRHHECLTLGSHCKTDCKLHSVKLHFVNKHLHFDIAAAPLFAKHAVYILKYDFYLMSNAFMLSL